MGYLNWTHSETKRPNFYSYGKTEWKNTVGKPTPNLPTIKNIHARSCHYLKMMLQTEKIEKGERRRLSG